MISEAQISAFKQNLKWEAWSTECDRAIRLTSKPILILLSAGADSVYLALALKVRYPEQAKRFVIVHYNHGLRGEESDGDEGFSKEMAESLGFSFHAERFEGLDRNASEQDLRNRRLAATDRLTKLYDAEWVLSGHHATDALEWGIMALFRGASPQGLSSPRELSTRDKWGYLRPLLSLTRNEIRENLNASGVSWREDSSNGKIIYTRNRLRNEVIPALRKAIPQDLEKGYARTKQLMSEANELLAFSFQQLKLDFGDAHRLDGKSLIGMPLALWRKSFYEWVQRHELSPSGLEGDRLDDFLTDWMKGRGQVRHRFEADGGFVEIVASEYCLQRIVSKKQKNPIEWSENYLLYPGACYYLPQHYRLGVTVIDGAELVEVRKNLRSTDSKQVAFLDYKSLGIPLNLRRWLKGDRYQPLGAPGSKKLQDWFVDRKIPPAERSCLPIITDAKNQIVWVPGFAPAELFKIKEHTEIALRLTYLPL